MNPRPISAMVASAPLSSDVLASRDAWVSMTTVHIETAAITNHTRQSRSIDGLYPQADRAGHTGPVSTIVPVWVHGRLRLPDQPGRSEHGHRLPNPAICRQPPFVEAHTA